jgi:hypothetical protein
MSSEKSLICKILKILVEPSFVFFSIFGGTSKTLSSTVGDFDF